MFGYKVDSKFQKEYLEAKAELQALRFESDKQREALDFERKKLQREFDFKKQDLQQQHNLAQNAQNAHNTEIVNMKASLVVKHEQDVAKIKHNNAQELIAEKERLNKEFYGRMTESLSDLHTKGNHATDFLKEMTLKMLDKAPTALPMPESQ